MAEGTTNNECLQFLQFAWNQPEVQEKYKKVKSKTNFLNMEVQYFFENQLYETIDNIKVSDEFLNLLSVDVMNIISEDKYVELMHSKKRNDELLFKIFTSYQCLAFLIAVYFTEQYNDVLNDFLNMDKLFDRYNDLGLTG